MILLQIIVANLIVGLISLINIVFLGKKLNIRRITFYLISLASGSLLGAAFLHLIPESIEKGGIDVVPLMAGGVFLFFILEKFLIWRHCHHHQRPEDHSRPVAASMLLVGDAVHNFLDGVIIASAFMAGFPFGLSITIAIMFHEIPQELGDFGVLIHGGYSVRKAILANILVGMLAVVGGVVTYFFLNSIPAIQYILLPVAAGGFLYIALADLIPQLHEQIDTGPALAQILLLGLGFGIMMVLLPL